MSLIIKWTHVIIDSAGSCSARFLLALEVVDFLLSSISITYVIEVAAPWIDIPWVRVRFFVLYNGVTLPNNI